MTVNEFLTLIQQTVDAGVVRSRTKKLVQRVINEQTWPNQEAKVEAQEVCREYIDHLYRIKKQVDKAVMVVLHDLKEANIPAARAEQLVRDVANKQAAERNLTDTQRTQLLLRLLVLFENVYS